MRAANRFLMLLLFGALLATGCATLAPPIEHEEEITVYDDGKFMTQEERDKEAAVQRRIELRGYEDGE